VYLRLAAGHQNRVRHRDLQSRSAFADATGTGRGIRAAGDRRDPGGSGDATAVVIASQQDTGPP
jgi:hypothetical protein